MKVSKVLMLEMKNILRNRWLYVSLIISIVLALGLVYAIKFLQGPFTIKAISGFYGIGSTVALAVFCTKLYVDDLSSGTVSLFFSNKKNRRSYFLGKLLAAVFLGILFGGVCAIVLIGASYYLGWQVNLIGYIIEPILIYVLFSVFNMELFFLFGIFYKNTNMLIVTTLITVLAVPSVVERINVEKASNLVKHMIRNVPVFFMVQDTKYLQLSSYKAIVLSIFIVVLFVSSYYCICKTDY